MSFRFKRCRSCQECDPTVSWRDGILSCVACNVDTKRVQSEPEALSVSINDALRFRPDASRERKPRSWTF
jgi:hypothetical protein